jgi:hypothetical protein
VREDAATRELARLRRENERLQRRLKQAEAIIDVQKKGRRRRTVPGGLRRRVFKGSDAPSTWLSLGELRSAQSSPPFHQAPSKVTHDLPPFNPL